MIESDQYVGMEWNTGQQCMSLAGFEETSQVSVLWKHLNVTLEDKLLTVWNKEIGYLSQEESCAQVWERYAPWG